MPEVVHLHGWDCGDGHWFGPNELLFQPRARRPILGKLGTSLQVCYRKPSRVTGFPPLNFCATIQDLADCALAMVDLEDSQQRPLEIVLAVPRQRRPKLRPDFAFEFVSFLRFLHAATAGSEMALHDHVDEALRTAAPNASLVFSINTRHVVPEIGVVLSAHIEELAQGMLEWLAVKDGAAGRRAPRCNGVCAPELQTAPATPALR
jgi:hypothetical protein